MKRKNLLHALTMMMVLAGQAALAQSAPQAECVRSGGELQKVPLVERAVANLGGISRLEGVWKLGGAAGLFKEVLIKFKSSENALQAVVRGLDGTPAEWGSIAVCTTTNPEVLQVKILDAKQSLYLKPGAGGTIELAQISNGQVGPFYSFQKQ